MKPVLEKKKVTIYMYTTGHGMIHLSMSHPADYNRNFYMILSTQTVELNLPVMSAQELTEFFNKEMALQSKANLQSQIDKLQAELDSHCDEA